MDWTQWLTLVLAVLGSGLGVFNTWRAVARDRVKLKVEPGLYIDAHSRAKGICIKVVNMGSPTVSVTEIGLRAGRSDLRFVPRVSHYAGCEKLPHRLESRAALTLFFRPGAEEDPELVLADHAYARTACGHTSVGRSEVLTQMLSNLRLAAEAAPLIDE